jgi:diguanylate cyclase (GGDEF)-like protein
VATITLTRDQSLVLVYLNWFKQSAMSLKKKLEEASLQFAGKIDSRVSEIEDACLELMKTVTSFESALAVEYMIPPVSKLAESAGILGFGQISEVAARLEETLVHIRDQKQALGEDERQRIREFTNQLRKLITAPRDNNHLDNTEADIPVTSIKPTDIHPLIYLISMANEPNPELITELTHFGYEVATLVDWGEAVDAIQSRPPAVIIFDVIQPENAIEFDLFKEIRQVCTNAPAALVMSDHDNMPIRLEAVRTGIHGFFRKPVDAARMAEILDQLTTKKETDPYRILIVEDDPDLADFNALLLEHAGARVKIVRDPLQVMEPLTNFRPDLMLMDTNLKGCTGIELASVVRQNDDFMQIPIVFLSAEKRFSRRLLALHSGGNDFLVKPVQPDVLVSSVMARAKRARIMSSLISRDSMTGLANHNKVKEQLEAEVHRAERDGLPLSFAMVDIDNFKNVNDTYGHWTGDVVIKTVSQVLRQRLRKTDFVGRYGGEEFAIILPNTDIAAAERVLNKIRKAFANIRHISDDKEFYVTFSCGIAGCPPVEDSTALRKNADEALYVAKNCGRNQVVVARTDTAISAL